MSQSQHQIPERIRPVLIQLREQLQSLYGQRLKKVILFGSQVRGDARPDSDVDVLVVLDGPVDIGDEIRRTSRIIGDLSLEHNLVLSRVFMDTDEFESGHEPLLLPVLREGIDL